jgi:hypothetical protein
MPENVSSTGSTPLLVVVSSPASSRYLSNRVSVMGAAMVWVRSQAMVDDTAMNACAFQSDRQCCCLPQVNYWALAMLYLRKSTRMYKMYEDQPHVIRA